MNQFKVAHNERLDRKRDLNVRLVMWGFVALLSGLAFFALYLAHSAKPELVLVLGRLTVGIVIVAVLGAHFLAASLSVNKSERDSVFTLTDQKILCQKIGRPDTEIELSDIKALYQSRHSLLVESKQSSMKTIVIPTRVEGFELLRTELAKQSPITMKSSLPLMFLTLVGSFFSWSVVLLSRDAAVVIGAATVALVLLTWGSIRLLARPRQRPKKVVIVVAIALGWMAAVLLVYLRIARIM